VLDLILNSYQLIVEQSIFLKVGIVVLLSVISPILFVPIMATMYLSGFIFGLYVGIAVAVAGYIISLFVYYYIGEFFYSSQLIKKIISEKFHAYIMKLNNMNFAHIVLFSLLVPFLLVSTGLGLLHKRMINIFAVFFGALPSIVIFVLAGSYGKNFVEAQDNNFIYYSMGVITLYIIGQKIFTTIYKEKELEK